MTIANGSPKRVMDVCPYCGGASHGWFSVADVNRRVSETAFHLNRCAACGLLFVANPPANLEDYYSDYHKMPASAEDLLPLLAGHRYKIDLIRRFASGGSLLEIGPSIGLFCHLALQAGFDVSAIEMDSGCVRFLAGRLGVRAVHSADPAAVMAAEDRRYDVICLWHSAEHLPAPWLVLEQAARTLNPGGLLVVAAPNPAAWQAEMMGPLWPHWDLPRHLFQLPMSWVETLGHRLGLTCLLATTLDAGSREFDRMGWTMWVQSFCGGSLPPLLWRIAMNAARLLQPWDAREGKGSAYTMVLRRPA